MFLNLRRNKWESTEQKPILPTSFDAEPCHRKSKISVGHLATPVYAIHKSPCAKGQHHCPKGASLIGQIGMDCPLTDGSVQN